MTDDLHARARIGDSEIIGRWQCKAEQAEADVQRLTEERAAFDAGQVASFTRQPRDNPYPQGELWCQWEDGYDCHTNRVLKADVQRLRALLTTLRHLAWEVYLAIPVGEEKSPVSLLAEDIFARIDVTLSSARLPSTLERIEKA